ncbi:MAG TPA: tetratricopeptide repeat protein [Streptosporangiaceae bacterium]
MAQLSREEFDAIEFGAARTGEHRAAAQQMNQLAATSVATGEMSRAEAYLRAGEQWLLADDPAAAATGFRQALADGGGTFVDARVSLARALFQLGRADEASGLITQLEDEGRRDPRLCDLVAELLVEQSDLIGALDWANTGVELCLPLDARTGQHTGASQGNGQSGEAAETAVPQQIPPGADVTELRLLLSLRYRIRNDLGLDEDSYDKLLDEL